MPYALSEYYVENNFQDGGGRMEAGKQDRRL